MTVVLGKITKKLFNCTLCTSTVCCILTFSDFMLCKAYLNNVLIYTRMCVYIHTYIYIHALARGGAHEGALLAEKLLEADSCSWGWGLETSFLQMWPLIGCTHSSGWPYTHAQSGGTMWAQGLKRSTWSWKGEVVVVYERSWRGESVGWIWLKAHYIEVQDCRMTSKMHFLDAHTLFHLSLKLTEQL